MAIRGETSARACRVRSATGRGGAGRRDRLILGTTLVGTILVYLDVFRAGFINFDDPDNVLDNVAIRSFSVAHLEHIVTTPLQFMYTPLVTLSYAVDYQIGGLQPWIYHTTNLLLHLANVVLVYHLCRALTRRAFVVHLATVAFAVHPVAADTVTWVSTRSTLLATLFSLATLLAYLRYRRAERPARRGPPAAAGRFRPVAGWPALAAALVFFVLAVLAKSTAVAVAPSLLLLDVCRGRRPGWRMLLEKLPFFAVAVAAGLAAIHFRVDQIAPYPYTVVDRVFVVCCALATYLVRVVVPYPLPFAYAYPPLRDGFLPWYAYLAPLLLAAVVVVLLRLRVPRRLLVFGLGFFVLNIVLSQVVLLEDNYTANRYAYLPYVGLFLIAGHLLDKLRERCARRDLDGVLAAALAALTLLCAVVSFRRVALWRDPVDVLDDAIAHEPGIPFLYNSRGMTEYDRGNYPAALADFTHAVTLDPRFTLGYYYQGVVRDATGDHRAAIAAYDTAIRLSPGFGYAFLGRGKARLALHDYPGAVADLSRAIALDPGGGEAYFRRGAARAGAGDPAGACADWRAARARGYPGAARSLTEHCPA